MRIDRVQLESLDPLRMFTHSSLFQDHEEEGGEEKDEQQEKREEDEKIALIWGSMTKKPHFQAKKIQGFFEIGPNLANLAQLLNRSDVQFLIQEKLKDEEHPNPKKREQVRIFKDNLKKLNGKIDIANKVWYRRIPLLSRVFWQIDRVKIPDFFSR